MHIAVPVAFLMIVVFVIMFMVVMGMPLPSDHGFRFFLCRNSTDRFFHFFCTVMVAVIHQCFIHVIQNNIGEAVDLFDLRFQFGCAVRAVDAFDIKLICSCFFLMFLTMTVTMIMFFVVMMMFMVVM